jgi:cytoskeletal protein RodZ
VTAVLSLQEADTLRVEPGQSTSCKLSLANTGSIVEQFTIMVLGETAEWTHSDPPVVSLFPGAQQTATLTFSPPRLHTTPAGEIPFAVKVIPSNEPEESVTEEGTITVGSFNDIGAELLPRVATGRVAARQKLAVDSRGNVAVPVAVSAVDAADAVKFRIRPSVLTTAPGEARFIRIRVKPKQRFWKGPPQQKPYKVQVAPEGEKPLVLDGGLSQRAVLPKWLYALVGIVAMLLLLWFLLVRPIVRSTAINSTKPALASQAAATKSLSNKLSATQSAVAANSAAVAALSGKPLPTTTTTTTTTTTVPSPPPTTVPPPVTGPSDGQMEVIAAPGSTATSPPDPVATGTTVSISDLVLQNVSGSAGTARVERVLATGAIENLLVINLGTLTNQEFTFSSPMEFTHDQQLRLRIDCQGNQTACDVNMYYSGTTTQPVSSTTTTVP